MNKKLTIIGAGTAGVLSAAHFQKWSNFEIELVYDPNTKPQAVGEGSTLQLPKSLLANTGFQYDDLFKIDGYFKHGIRKENWSSTGNFTHTFPPPEIAYHFNATKLQNYLLDYLSRKIKITQNKTDISLIDSNFIMDCSGKPESFDDFYLSEYIPVNAVHVTQCYWDKPRFSHTLTIARPYGWVFGIPLQNRCSIGYLYNHNITTLDLVKKDVGNIFQNLI